MSYIKEELTDQQRFNLMNKELKAVIRKPKPSIIRSQVEMLISYEKKIDSGVATKKDIANYNDLLDVIAASKNDNKKEKTRRSKAINH